MRAPNIVTKRVVVSKSALHDNFLQIYKKEQPSSKKKKKKKEKDTVPYTITESGAIVWSKDILDYTSCSCEVEVVFLLDGCHLAF